MRKVGSGPCPVASFSGNAVTKTTGTVKLAQDVVDGIETGAAVGQTNVGNHEAGLLRLGRFQGILVGARNGHDAMTQAFQDALQIQRDERFVLDDENVGRDLPADLGAGFLQQFVDAPLGHFQNAGGLRVAEAFDGDQQESLPAFRRQRGQRAGRRIADQSQAAGRRRGICASESRESTGRGPRRGGSSGKLDGSAAITCRTRATAPSPDCWFPVNSRANAAGAANGVRCCPPAT